MLDLDMVLGKVLAKSTLLKSDGSHMEGKMGDAPPHNSANHAPPPKKKVEENFQRNEAFIGIIVN